MLAVIWPAFRILGVVTYQLLLTNGTRVNLSSDQDCSSELWMWLSSPVFLYCDPTCLSHKLSFTLNYFLEWKAPQIIITTTTAPCREKIGEFLSEMTASVNLLLRGLCVLHGIDRFYTHGDIFLSTVCTIEM